MDYPLKCCYSIKHPKYFNYILELKIHFFPNYALIIKMEDTIQKLEPLNNK